MKPGPFAGWSSDEWLILFARWPQRGTGKSRLAAAVGDERTYQLQRAFLLDTIEWAASAPSLLVALTPSAASREFWRAFPHARLRAQSESDLGGRIHRAFVDAFAMGAARAVIIGSDSPNLPPRIVQACMDGLSQADAVVAPASDGGFCALGLTEPMGRLFDGVHWSTPAVYQQLLANARRLGLSIRSTEPWYDIDDLAGLQRLRADLSLDGAFTPHTRVTLARMNRH